MSAIEREILDATGFTASKKYPSRQDYLAALARAVNQLEDTDYYALSEAAQDWFNAAVSAMGNKGDIKEFPDTVELPLVEMLLQDPEDPAPQNEPYPEPKPARKKGQPAKKLEAKTVQHPEEYATDKWGLMVGSKASAAADLFEKGARMADVKVTLGSTQYNMLNRLKEKGHKLEKHANGVLKLVYVEQ